MNDHRQRAPFLHQSSSADLAGQAKQLAQSRRHGVTSPTERIVGGSSAAAHPLSNPVTANGVSVGAGPSSAAAGSYFPASLAAAAATSARKERKGSDDLGSHLSPTSLFASYGGGGAYSLNTPPVPARTPSPFRLRFPLSSTASNLPISFDGVADSLRLSPGVVQTTKFVALCALWYSSSAVSSNTGKVILNAFKFPVTLTIVQFAFVAGLCWLGSRRQFGWTGRLRRPTRAILRGTLPMAAFQVGGHIFSSLAISRVPVSTVHTIKALSPLFTVLAYGVLFGVSYSPATYLSLLPLTLGVMLACSFDLSASSLVGLVCAFGSTLVFVSQNIFFKKIMPSAGSATASTSALGDSPRLDKINLLYFSSSMAFILMIPLWLYSDVPRLLALYASAVPRATPASTVAINFFINGTVHFAQNVLAFAILSSTSPVTYSIASLVKRIAVICLAIVWFKQPTHPVQAAGILLTAVGLWMYNGAKRDVERGEKRVRHVEAVRDGILPTTKADQLVLEGRASPPVGSPIDAMGMGASLNGGNPGLGFPMQASPAYEVPPHKAYSVDVSSPYAPPPQAHGAPMRAYKNEAVHHEPYPSPPASTTSSPPHIGIGRSDDVQPLALAAA